MLKALMALREENYQLHRGEGYYQNPYNQRNTGTPGVSNNVTPRSTPQEQPHVNKLDETAHAADPSDYQDHPMDVEPQANDQKNG